MNYQAKGFSTFAVGEVLPFDVPLAEYGGFNLTPNGFFLFEMYANLTEQEKTVFKDRPLYFAAKYIKPVLLLCWGHDVGDQIIWSETCFNVRLCEAGLPDRPKMGAHYTVQAVQAEAATRRITGMRFCTMSSAMSILVYSAMHDQMHNWDGNPAEFSDITKRIHLHYPSVEELVADCPIVEQAGVDV